MKYVYKNNLSELDQLAADVEIFADRKGLSPGMGHAFNLCLDEILTNIISYGYSDDAQHEIKLELSCDDQEVVASISDDGRPFNPLEDAQAPDLESSLEEREVGGLGIHFLKKLMDSLEYRYENGRNILTLRKRVEPTD